MWYKEKTTWTGFGMIIAGGVALYTGQGMTQGEAIQTILAGFGLIFVRRAIANK